MKEQFNDKLHLALIEIFPKEAVVCPKNCQKRKYKKLCPRKELKNDL